MDLYGTQHPLKMKLFNKEKIIMGLTGTNNKNNVSGNTIKFNWQIYILLHKDLQNAGISTQKKAVDHWENHGKKEGRIYNFYDVHPDFNWRKYIELYPDLKTGNITTEESAIIHYLKYGKNERRVFS
jgi:hypothetical protein